MQALIIVEDVSKILKTIYKKPFFVFLLEYLKKQKFKKIIVSSSNDLSQLKTYIKDKYKKLKIDYFDSKQLPLNKNPNLSKKPFFVFNGECIIDINYKKIINKKTPMLFLEKSESISKNNKYVYFFPKNKKDYNLNDISSFKNLLEGNNLSENDFKLVYKDKVIHIDDDLSLKLLKNNIFHLRFNNYSMNEAVESIEEGIKSQSKSLVVPVNLDMMRVSYKDIEFQNIINNSDISLIDGKPLIWFSNLYRKKFKHKVSGSDLVYPLLEMMNKNGYSLFIVGGKEDVAAKAMENIKDKYEDIKIAGFYSPPYGFEKDEKETDKTIEKINEANPQVVLLCLSAPKQEKFYSRNKDKLISATYVCAGATVDFLAGQIKRAPKWMSSIGLEWFFRLLKEPKRLIKRYWLDFWFIPKIMFLRIFKKKLK